MKNNKLEQNSKSGKSIKPNQTLILAAGTAIVIVGQTFN